MDYSNNVLQNPSEHVGCLWRLNTTSEGIIEGILKDYFPGNKSFTFDKVEQKLDDGECEYLGTLGLFYHEIKDASVIDRNEEIRLKYCKNKILVPRTDKNDYCISRRDLECVSDDEEDQEPLESEDEVILTETSDIDANITLNFSTNDWKEPFSHRLQFVDLSTDENSISLIMKDINNSTKIGLNAVVEENGLLDLWFECVLISTDNSNYVFTEKTWSTILKETLESKEIAKVVYGCGPIARVLYKKHGICIEAIEDLQVLEFKMRQMKQTGQRPKVFGARTYYACLQEYLGIHVDPVFSQKYNILKATHPSETFDSFCKLNVMPLKQLRSTLFKKYMEKVVYSTVTVMNAFVEASEAEYKLLKEHYRVNCSLLNESRESVVIPVPEPLYSEEDTIRVIGIFKEIKMREKARNEAKNQRHVQYQKPMRLPMNTHSRQRIQAFERMSVSCQNGSLSSEESEQTLSSDDCCIVSPESESSFESRSATSDVSLISEPDENIFVTLMPNVRPNKNIPWPQPRTSQRDISARKNLTLLPAGYSPNLVYNPNLFCGQRL